MSCLEKRHISHRNNMQHHRNLNGSSESFMDETDREVMSLTDRAFRSLCIGDEAVYNDSEFSPSPVSCHKPLAEEIPKRALENSSSVVRKHSSHLSNNTSLNQYKSSKVSSLFAAFSTAAEKNGNGIKMTNGETGHSDSWDKSALLSIQRELSEFSTDYHNNLRDKHSSHIKNHQKPTSKETAKKSSTDVTSSEGKSSKNKHGKSSKLRKLNSRNFFLHSEFSPFQSWKDFNRFPFGQESISDLLPADGLPNWYDSSLYKKLSAAHRNNNPQAKETELYEKETKAPPPENKPVMSQSSKQVVSPSAERQTQVNKPEIQIEELHTKVVQSPSASEQRCSSEKGDPCAPWRKNRSREKSAIPVDQPCATSSPSGKSKGGEQNVHVNKKEVKTMEDAASKSSTPFSISQLLTPVIPSRQGTETSEILQTVLSPTVLDLLPLPETEIRPSPEIKRDNYKAMASSLLFNLKDNRKRVKTMYSPPKFKGVDAMDQKKKSPMTESPLSKNALEVPETTNDKLSSPVHQKIRDFTPSMSVIPEVVDNNTMTPKSNVDVSVLDDYLALNLLQTGNHLIVPENCRYGGSQNASLKSNKSPVLNKVTYPSLNLYHKASPVTGVDKNIPPVIHPSCQAIINKSSSLGQTDNNMKAEESTSKLVKGIVKELQGSITEPVLNTNKTGGKISIEKIPVNKPETLRTGETSVVKQCDSSELKEKYSLAVQGKEDVRPETDTSDKNQMKDKGGLQCSEQLSFKDKEDHIKDLRAKHVFSARQNSYIKSQRYASADGDEYVKGYKDVSLDREVADAYDDTGERLKLSEYVKNNEVRHSKEKTKNVYRSEEMNEQPMKESAQNQNRSDVNKDLEAHIKSDFTPPKEHAAMKSILSMKGNTLAKKALFAKKEHEHSKSSSVLRKENKTLDKYDLAKAALEEVIAERELRGKKGKSLPKEDHIQDDASNVLEYEKQKVTQDVQYVKAQDKQRRMSLVNEKPSANAQGERRINQKSTSAFKSSDQTVQTILEAETKHAESRVNEIKLAGLKQGTVTEHCQHASRQTQNTEGDKNGYSELKIDSEVVSNADKGRKPQDEEDNTKNVYLFKNSKGSDESELSDVKQVENYAEIMRKSSYKPEVPPRRGRLNPEGEDRILDENKRVHNDMGKVDKSTENKELARKEANRTKDKVPGRGNVSVLKHKYDKEQSILGVQRKDDVKDNLYNGEGPKDHTAKEKMKPQVVVSRLTEKALELEDSTTNDNYNEVEVHVGHSDYHLKHSKQNEEISGCLKDCSTNKSPQPPECEILSCTVDKHADGFKDLKEVQGKSQSKSSVRDFLSLLGVSSSEKANTADESVQERDIAKVTTTSSKTFKTDRMMDDSITVHDILRQPETSPPLLCNYLDPCVQSNLPKELTFPADTKHKSSSFPETGLLREVETSNVTGKEKDDMEKTKMDQCCLSNKGSETDNLDGVASPSEQEKGGWVRSLMEFANELTPKSQSNTSSPAFGKPVLFKVKDNTFRESPITKTVRPILHKSIHDTANLLSPKESLSGSERGEVDLDPLKECPEISSPSEHASSPVKSPQTSESSMHHIAQSPSQLVTAKDRKGQQGRLTVPEEEERSSIVSTMSEGMDNSETHSGDPVDEIASNAAPTEDSEISKVSSERSESACSAAENHSQGKPPAVPPKTEKALRRAMKLTTRRIQKAEAKSKNERKGRSAEKGSSHKTERRHHSCEKSFTDETRHKVHSRDRASNTKSDRRNETNEHHLSEKVEPKVQRRSENLKSTRADKVIHNNDKHVSQKHIHKNVDERQRSGAEQVADNLEPKAHTENRYVRSLSDRQSRSSEKYVPDKLERRTHSLDRFVIYKRESQNSEQNVTDFDVEFSPPVPHHPTSKALPMRQNSTECSYAPTATNIVAQSFPMTQRKVLQDPDSGHYFVVDMPVQVKTKTFFDPETGSYVQLPVQSAEVGVPQAQSVEVVNAPPFVLYHGFVPVPLSSLVAQKSATKPGESMVSPQDFSESEHIDSQIVDDAFSKQQREEHHYTELEQDHTSAEELDSRPMR